MMIYGEIDTRLDPVVKFDSEVADSPYLLVAHPNNTERWIEDELPQRLNHVYCCGILLVKGVPRAGIGEERFQSLKDLYGSRFHISARAVGTAQEDTRLSGARAAQFARFFQYAREKDVLDWSILDPPWPESVLAVYLLAKVMSANTEACGVIANRRDEWEPIWEEAKREYKSLTHEALNCASLDGDTAEGVATQIGQYLTNVELTIPCDVSRQRGRLRHIWLKNQILAMNEDYVVLMHTSPSLRAARESFERKIRPKGEFAGRLEDARQLLSEMVEGFGPGQLIDSGLLGDLSTDARDSIKSVLHDQYLKNSMMAQSSEAITKAVKDLRTSLRELSTAWYQQPSADDALIRKKFADFQLNAKVLQESLGNLPEGIVLP